MPTDPLVIVNGEHPGWCCRDPEALVTYLSLHLGRSNPEETWYYFHLAADFRPDLRRLANTDLESILPEASRDIR
ncbi:hypothetical protein [Arthrobacter sp. MMS18-M83]|uniref:hypothetical protein n=1 Tax=Arthrobacter sp. MMS18-M83 TaxID=2996261 RepID=UPI00227CF356|nr:hypothetical protein [Arthrobacter sp. MMS18-M83]WAH97772.1 hypothetical protein OW521_02400 [Arthrobacter sp. MMS18-M83]